VIPRELTPIQVARIFGVSAQTVRRWEDKNILIPRRRLPGIGSRRYDAAEVEALRREVMGEFLQAEAA
jgi:DNA-binding transcriptional MerR regulator